MAAWGGIASLELALPAMWTGRAAGAWRPAARRAGWRKRRRVSRGSRRARAGSRRAERPISGVDPDATFVVEGPGIHHRHKLTPYIGRTLHGVVRKTWLRGRPVFSEAVPSRARPRARCSRCLDGQH